jgi:mannose-6-phosphate isomerase-like protein (cupin superfamily)
MRKTSRAASGVATTFSDDENRNPVFLWPEEVQNSRMIIRPLDAQAPFTTKDGSRIRSILDRANAPVANQSLAEAVVPTGCATQRHYHRLSEEFYFILAGTGRMEIDGEEQTVGPGDGILIPPGAWHTITAESELRFLCCCAPPYAHEDTYFQ